MQAVNDRIRVLHLRDSKGLYGAERVIFAIGKHLDTRLFDFSLMCMQNRDGKSGSLIAGALAAGIEVIPVEVSGRFDPRGLRRIRKLLKDRKISIIHSHDYKSDFYGLLASIGSGVKRVSTAHGSTRDSFLKRLYLFFGECVVYRFLDSIIAVSKDIAVYLGNCGIHSQRIHIVPNGLDFANMDAGSGEDDLVAALTGRKVFGIVGRLFPDKGHRLFLDAFAQVAKENPSVAAVVVGDGPLVPEIRRQVEDLGLEDSVVLCGFRSDMPSIYSLLDFLVMPSLREGLPYTLLEAMYYRVPVLATAVGEIPQLIENGVTGCLVAPADGEGLRAGMEALLSDPANAKTMAERAYELVVSKYSAEAMVRNTERVYSGLVS